MRFVLILLACSCAVADYATDYAAAVAEIDFGAVAEDLKVLFKDSKEDWPADYGNYGPFFIRLAWHCSGSYRNSDGRGGCEGGRQRFDPERSWADNTNLDKARALLWPLKKKYGLGLSWGDLFILAGDTAIESMGGTTLGFCGGRIDDPDGSESLELGPSIEQQIVAPCAVNGTCKSPLGSTTVGLIYLNPEGPMGQPNPEGSSRDVRDAFGRMSMNDSETVALIGGGHSFGKSHGACPAGPGPDPDQDPSNPWPGACGTGKGVDTFTSGFEGPWTSNPLKWDNSYFKELLAHSWEVHIGPGGHNQWKPTNNTPMGPPVANGSDPQPIMMLTSDVSLLHDANYTQIVKRFANDLADFENSFAHAWYKLTTRDVGPVTRCVGKRVPPAQPFQYPLPSPPAKVADMTEVRKMIVTALTTESKDLPGDDADGKKYYGAWFVQLAYQCASTFRQTDNMGGCNGARIRFAPQNTWPDNVDMDKVLKLLEPIKSNFGDSLSWADLIVLAGQVAIEQAGGKAMPFCPKRTDASGDDGASTHLGPLVYADPVLTLREQMKRFGFSVREMTALFGRMRSGMQQQARGYSGSSYTSDPSKLSNLYFNTLVSEKWENVSAPSSGQWQYKAKGKDIYMLQSDLALIWEPEFQSAVYEFAADNELFLTEFASAWTKLVTADRFEGPTNYCNKNYPPAAPASASSWSTAQTAAVSIAGTILGGTLLATVYYCCMKKKEISDSDREHLMAA